MRPKNRLSPTATKMMETHVTVTRNRESFYAEHIEAVRQLAIDRFTDLLDENLAHLAPGQGLLVDMGIETVDENGVLLRGANARNSEPAKEWRTAVFERDAYACRKCGAKGRIMAHHIEEWSKAPDKRYDVDNGLTLCVECHAAEHPETAHLIRKARSHHPGTT